MEMTIGRAAEEFPPPERGRVRVGVSRKRRRPWREQIPTRIVLLHKSTSLFQGEVGIPAIDLLYPFGSFK